MKIKVVEKCEIKRVYEFEAEPGEDGCINTDEIYDKLYSGDYEPTHIEEEGNEITMYDEDDNPIEA